MKQYLQEIFAHSLAALGLSTTQPILFEKPRQPDHGDLTTNIALVLAKEVGRKPRDLARDLLAHCAFDNDLIEKVEIAGPGFINVRFAPEYFYRQTRAILDRPEAFGRNGIGVGKKAQVEFVSANPTGPLTVGHGRGAVYGDTVANLLEWCGYDVTREYYFNNAGRQMRILGDSVRLRYLELLGDAVEYPEDYYQGEYIREIASGLRAHHGDALRHEPAEGIFKEQAEREIFGQIKNTLASLGIIFQSFFNENSLYVDGKIEKLIADLRSRDLVYDQDGALWFRLSRLGGEKDKVIVKSSGEPTYRLPDIAYHREKYHRGYDLMVDIFGADHIATYPDVLAGLGALEYDVKKVRVLIHQFVTITENGEIVKMSTRKANYVTLDELIADVGNDVVRYFFIMRSIGSHLNFDLALARQHSEENPVYYLQYAHARISSIIRVAEQENRSLPDDPPLKLLRAFEELFLLKLLSQFPDMIESCALSFEPHRLSEYLHDLAGAFHKFYHVHRVISDDLPLMAARMALCRAARAVLRNGFAVLGIAAPDQM